MPDRFTDQLSEYLDGELDAAARTGLEQHLRECAECRATLADLRRLVAEARVLPPRAPGDGVWAGIAREIGTSRALPHAPSRPARRLTSPLLIAASLLVAATLGAFGSLWWRDSRGASLADETRWLMLLHISSGPRLRPPSGEDLPTIIGKYAAWRREHAQIGEKLAGGPGLRLAPDGDPTALSAEDPVGGLYIISAQDEAEALAIARTCPHLTYGGWIELRRIEDTSHVR